MNEKTKQEELLANLEQLQNENRELKESIERYRSVDRKLSLLNNRIAAGDQQFNILLNLLPIGVSICTDVSCQEIRHNPEAARFLRIKEWEILSHSVTTPPPVKLQFKGQLMLPKEMPIQRSLWFGEQIQKKEIDFIWDDGICKTSLWSSTPIYDQKGVIIGAVAVCEDITERKQIQNKLEKKTQQIQEQLYEIEEIYKSVPIGLCLLDKNLRYLRLNQRYAEINGISIEEHLGRTPQQIFPSLDEQENIMRAVLISGEPVINFEISVIFPEQPEVIRYWNKNMLPVRNKSGKVTGLCISTEEITERKEMELALSTHVNMLEQLVKERTFKLYEINEELRISEERFCLALANSPTQVFNQDKELRYTWFYNLKTEFSMKDVIGKTDKELFPSEHIPLTTIKRRVLDTGISVREVVKLTIHAKEFYFDLFVYPIYNREGLVNGITCVSTDITDRKMTEEALKQSEKKFSKAFRSSPVMMSIVKKETLHYLDVNDAWLRTFNLKWENVVNRKTSDCLWNNPDLHEKLSALDKDKSLFNYEISFQVQEGIQRYGLASSEIITIDGETCILQSILDVTEQKRMEKEMARLERLNTIGEMAASIGHEIRNPLTSIRGFLQLLSQNDQSEENQVYYELMIEELDRANEIISEFLGMAKDKKADLQLKYLDSIVKALSPMIQSDANHKDINVEYDLNLPPRLLVDENEIRQLILNLTRNGLDAMSPGGTLTIGTSFENNEILLSVRDQGNGIPADIMDKIGSPFVTTKASGTGLGLAVCYSIAARHNASIDFETGPAGTTFYIHFPVPIS